MERRYSEVRDAEMRMKDFEPVKAGSNRMPRNGVFLQIHFTFQEPNHGL